MTSAAAYSNQSSPSFTLRVVKSAVTMIADLPEDNVRDEEPQPIAAQTSLGSKLLNALIETLEQVLESIRAMKSREAQALLNGLAHVKSGIDQMRNDVSTPLRQGASQMDARFYRLAELVVEIYDDLEIAADDTPVDENSSSYKIFLKEMVTEAEATPAIFGRKALFSFLED